MTALLAFGVSELTPIIVFGAIVVGAWFLMSALSRRTSAAEERLARLGRPSMGDVDSLIDPKQRFKGIKEAIASLGGAMEGKSDLERNKLKLQLVNAG